MQAHALVVVGALLLLTMAACKSRDADPSALSSADAGSDGLTRGMIRNWDDPVFIKRKLFELDTADASQRQNLQEDITSHIISNNTDVLLDMLLYCKTGGYNQDLFRLKLYCAEVFAQTAPEVIRRRIIDSFRSNLRNKIQAKDVKAFVYDFHHRLQNPPNSESFKRATELDKKIMERSEAIDSVSKPEVTEYKTNRQLNTDEILKGLLSQRRGLKRNYFQTLGYKVVGPDSQFADFVDVSHQGKTYKVAKFGASMRMLAGEIKVSTLDLFKFPENYRPLYITQPVLLDSLWTGEYITSLTEANIGNIYLYADSWPLKIFLLTSNISDFKGLSDVLDSDDPKAGGDVSGIVEELQGKMEYHARDAVANFFARGSDIIQVN